MDIVIVDDEPKIRNGLERLLSAEQDFHVAGAFDEAQKAFAYLEENPVDVLVTDIRMPEISGLELITRIRELNRELQIIILSGYSDFSYAQKAIELGVRRYLTKPTNTVELMTILQKISRQVQDRQAKENKSTDAEASNLIVLKALQYIETNYSKKITLGGMAAELFVTPNYLCRLFKRNMHKNLMKYLIEFRMEKAKVLLKDVRYKIVDVAEMVGYNGTKYFSSSFKKIYGITPMEYRNTK